MDNQIIYIYALSDTDKNIVRYVGKTCNPKKRILKHISDAKNLTGNKHKCNWIRKVLKNGYSIKIEILEICNEDNWPDREKFWIKQFNNLVNISEGGESGGNKKYTKSIKVVKKWVNKNIPNIITKESWFEYVKFNSLPKFIPKDPYTAYKCRGWVSWGNFLNNEKEPFLNYNECKEWIKINYPEITTQKIWRENKINFPNFIPKRPDSTYNNCGWISWKSFFEKDFLSYSECKEFMNINFPEIKSKKDFDNFSKTLKRPKYIPSTPYTIYKDSGWISWGKFLSKIN